jgi:hypothetical protein
MSEMLETYLQDHLAGSTVGLELARRTAGSNEGSRYGARLDQLVTEIAEDRESLLRVMERLEVGPSRLKNAGGWTMEKLGRLKPNNRWLSYSPLSRVLELEGLLIGVTGKLALWESLRVTLGEQLDGIDFAELSARATDQRSRLEEMRRSAAIEAFEHR